MLLFFKIFGTFGLLVDSRNLFCYIKKLLPQIFYEKATRRQFLAEKSHVTLARKLRSKQPEKISSNHSVHCFLVIFILTVVISRFFFVLMEKITNYFPWVNEIIDPRKLQVTFSGSMISFIRSSLVTNGLNTTRDIQYCWLKSLMVSQFGNFNSLLKVTCGVQFPLVTCDDRIYVTFMK